MMDIQTFIDVAKEKLQKKINNPFIILALLLIAKIALGLLSSGDLNIYFLWLYFCDLLIFSVFGFIYNFKFKNYYLVPFFVLVFLSYMALSVFLIDFEIYNLTPKTYGIPFFGFIYIILAVVKLVVLPIAYSIAGWLGLKCAKDLDD